MLHAVNEERGKLELAVFGADSGDLRAGVAFDDWRFEIRVMRFSATVQDGSFEYRAADDGCQDGECVFEALDRALI